MNHEAGFGTLALTCNTNSSYPVIVQFRVVAYLPIRVFCFFCLSYPYLNSCIAFLYLKEPGMVHSRYHLFHLAEV